MKIAVLGPNGTYSAQAARTHYPDTELVLCRTIKEVVEKVAGGVADEGLLPMENSSEGLVSESLGEISLKDLFVTSKVMFDIHHVLCGLDPQVSASDVKEIHSHPQALKQCSQYIASHYPGAKKVAANSTAAAIQTVSKGSDAAILAIGSESAAGEYNLAVIDRNIEDNHDNRTRFIVISKANS